MSASLFYGFKMPRLRCDKDVYQSSEAVSYTHLDVYKRQSLIILAALPLLAAAVYIVIRVTVPIYKRVQQRLDRISAVVRENLSGVRVIRAFSKEQKENCLLYTSRCV